MSSLTRGIKLAPLLVNIKADIKSFKNNMSEAAVVGVGEAKKISKELSNVTRVSEKLSKVGTNLTKYVSLPLAGAGIAVGKMAVDFESNFAKVSTLLDENIVNFDDYKKSLLKASGDSKIAVDEFSEAVYGSISAGVDQTKAISFTTEAMKLAKGGFTSGAKAVDVMTTAINGYKLKTEDATRVSDLLINTQNLGKTTVDELASSMGAVIPVASAANYSIDELSTAYALMTKNGIATSEAGTYVKSMLSELTKSGSKTDKVLRELTEKGFAELKVEGKSTSEIFSILNEYAKENNITLKDMFGSVEAGTAAMVLASGDGKEYNEILKSMEKSAGATKKAFDKIDSTPAEKMKGSLIKMKNAGIELGITLVPVVEKVADLISGLADKFSGLSSEQQENILKWGAIALAAGPTLKLVGGGVKTFTNLKSIIGGVSKGLKVFSEGSKIAGVATSTLGSAASVAGGTAGVGGLMAGLGGVVSATAPFLVAGAAVAATGYGIYKTMSSEVVPSVDLFADSMVASGTKITEYGQVVTYETIKISDATKEAVQSYLDMDYGITNSLNNLYINSTAITEETCNTLTQSYKDMGQSITAGLIEDKNNDTNILNDFFETSTSLTEEEKKEILDKTNQLYSNKEAVVNEKTSSIKAILENAKNANRELHQEEMEEINNIQQEMKDMAIKTLSDNEIEAKVILERMKANDQRISAEQAAEHIKVLNNSRDEAIKIANSEYDEKVKSIIRMRDETGNISESQAKKMIDEATKQKDGIIKRADETRIDAIDKMRSMNKDLDKEVDTSTGEILTKWDKVKRWWSGWQPESKTFSTTTIESKIVRSEADGSHYNGLNYVPYDGYMARLHKGERVLTAKENRDMLQGKSETDKTTINFNGNYGFNNQGDIDYFLNQAAIKLKGVRQ